MSLSYSILSNLLFPVIYSPEIDSDSLLPSYTSSSSSSVFKQHGSSLSVISPSLPFFQKEFLLFLEMDSDDEVEKLYDNASTAVSSKVPPLDLPLKKSSRNEVVFSYFNVIRFDRIVTESLFPLVSEGNQGTVVRG
jgi:hypothetical protein